MTRTAVVLFNLGGPDRPEAVRPFLFNLFNDRAIIGAPQPFRWLIAKLVSRRRAPIAAEMYRELGGGSPLLANTEAQAQALAAALGGGSDLLVTIAMRYWHPLTEAAVAAVQSFAPDQVVLLPLYPQYSTTTTGSSLAAWNRTSARARLSLPTSGICCYPVLNGFIAAIADLIRPALDRAAEAGVPRILFSAHGLPKRVVDRGDPYQHQVERTAAAVVEALGVLNLDWVVCYQSRVGPLEWIGPYTEHEIDRAGRDQVPVVLVPVAFVSEHSETLVELDILYRERAVRAGVPRYERVATVGTHPAFIGGLASLVKQALARGQGIAAEGGSRLCPADRTGCFCQGR